jgi:hypothetical protein
VPQLPKNDRHLNLRLSQDLYDKALAAATAEQRPLSSWIRKLVHRELADRLSAGMDREDGMALNLPSRQDEEETKDCPSGCDWRGHPIHAPGCPKYEGSKPLRRDTVEPRFKGKK